MDDQTPPAPPPILAPDIFDEPPPAPQLALPPASSLVDDSAAPVEAGSVDSAASAAAGAAPPPREPRPPPMPDPRAAAGQRWISPQDEYVHSLENGGAGVPLTVVARRWEKNYDDLKVKARGKPLPDGGGYEPGTSWREMRAAYLDRLWRAQEERAIASVAENQAKLEAQYAEVAQAQLMRIRREVRRRLGDEANPDPKKRRKPVDLEVKSDKELVDMLDKLSKVHRRNVGLPETSHEVRGRVEFVQMVIGRVTAIIRRYERDPVVLRAIGSDFLSLQSEMARDEDALAGLGAVIDVPG